MSRKIPHRDLIVARFLEDRAAIIFEEFAESRDRGGEARTRDSLQAAKDLRSYFLK